LTKEFTSLSDTPTRDEASNLALHQSRLDATDACPLACADTSWDGCSLKIVDAHKIAINLATQQSGEFRVGYKMEATSQIIAGECLGLPAARDGNSLEYIVALCSHRPTAGCDRHSSKVLLQLESLHDLS